MTYPLKLGWLKGNPDQDKKIVEIEKKLIYLEKVIDVLVMDMEMLLRTFFQEEDLNTIRDLKKPPDTEEPRGWTI